MLIQLENSDLRLAQRALIGGMNQRFNYPGVTEWNDVVINMIDVQDSVKEVSKILDFQFFDFMQKDGIAKTMTSKALATVAEAASKSKATDDPTAKGVTQTKEKEPETPTSQGTFGAAAKSTEQKKSDDKDAKDDANKLKDKGLGGDTAAANNFVIQQLSDEGAIFRTWTLVNSFIKGVSYGDLDYSSDDLVSLEIVIGYDYATAS
jgi:hypothetical protein